MRIYLDNCCFNRPFDDQSQIRIKLESEAKLEIQDRIRKGELELAWSYILDLENSAILTKIEKTRFGLGRTSQRLILRRRQRLLRWRRRFVPRDSNSKTAFIWPALWP